MKSQPTVTTDEDVMDHDLHLPMESGSKRAARICFIDRTKTEEADEGENPQATGKAKENKSYYRHFTVINFAKPY